MVTVYLMHVVYRQGRKEKYAESKEEMYNYHFSF